MLRAEAEIPCATSLLDHFRDRLAAHGYHPLPAAGRVPGLRYFIQNCEVVFSLDRDRLTLALAAPTPALLSSFKDNAVRIIAEMNAGVADAIRWSDQVDEGAAPAGFHLLRLLRRQHILPGLERFTFLTDDVDGLAHGGLHIRLLVPPSRDRAPCWPAQMANGRLHWPEGKDRLAVRVYTLRHLRPELGEVDVDIVIHGRSALAGAAIGARPGDLLGAMGPGGGGAPPADHWLLLGGDATALPVLARSFELLPNAYGHCIVAASPEAAGYLSAPPSIELQIVATDGKPLLEAMKSVSPPAGARAFAAFAGEHADAVAMRAHFRQALRLPPKDMVSATYWRRSAMPH
jgi:NADPH-dependent ferric siderophore reductase